MPNRVLLAVMAVAVVACSEPLTSPTTGSDLVTRSSASAKSMPPMMERAIIDGIDGNGVTTLYVTSGSFAYFDEATRQNVPAIPGTGVLNHVHVKFCKNTYKDYGLHQFSANFHYKAVAVDKEFDGEPDSPLDPGDKTHKQVNWDRSAASTTLQGGGEASFKFTGIPAGASLEVHYNYTAANGKNYSIKICTPVLTAPDLAIETVAWPTSVQAGVPTVFESTIGVVGSSSVPATASCAIYENGVLLGKSPIINVSSVSGEFCDVTITFTSSGSHTLEVRIEDISPSDLNLANNFATGVVGVSGGTIDPGTGGGSFVPTEIWSPTVWQSIDTTFVKDPTTGAVLSVTSWNHSQGAKLILSFKFTSFTGPTSIIVSATTDGRVIQAPTTISGTGPCIAGGTTYPVSFSVTLCNETLSGVTSEDATLTYQINATVNSTNNLAGTFVPYGSAITYNIAIINGGYKYTLPANALTTSVVPVNQTPCGFPMAFSACPLSGEYRVRSDADSWFESITGITGVAYP